MIIHRKDTRKLGDPDSTQTRPLPLRLSPPKGGNVVTVRNVTRSSNLAKLDLSRCDIGDKDAKDISNKLMNNGIVVSLNLRYNSIGPDGAMALAFLLRSNIAIVELDLGYNHLGDVGVQYLSEALMSGSDKEMPSLRRICLKSNNVGPEGCRSLAAALCCNSNLFDLDLGHNHLGDAGAHIIAEALLFNRNLKKLNLENNSIASEGGNSLATLGCNGTLVELNLKRNAVGNIVGDAFVTILSDNDIRLSILNLEKNGLSAEMEENISRILERKRASCEGRMSGMMQNLALVVGNSTLSNSSPP